MIKTISLAACLTASLALAQTGKGEIQVVAIFTNSMFPQSASRFEVQTDGAGVIRRFRFENPSYQPVPPDHELGAVAKGAALDVYQNYKTIVLRGGPIDYDKGEGNFVVRFLSGGGYLECPFVLRRGGGVWEMYNVSSPDGRPIKSVHALINPFSGVQQVQGGLRCGFPRS
jgi:hypothetical protein